MGEADESRDSLSPPRKLNRNSSIQDRASAFKAQGPVRRWSRTTNTNGEGGGGEAYNNKSSNAGGIDMKNNVCRFGKRCTNKSCWFEHTNGRAMDGTATLTDEDSSSDDTVKVSSMGKASLRLLVRAIVADTGKSSYLNVRNALQKPDQVGRDLTREEKNSVGEILEELESSASASPKTITKRNSITREPSAKAWSSSRGTGRSSFSRGSFTGGRVSLADMCRDPSIHSRLSSANTAC